MDDGVDVLDVEERVEDAVRVVELDEPRRRAARGASAPRSGPLLRAVEVFEHREPALQQIGAKRLGLAVGEVPESGLPHERDRILEQLRIVERQDQAAVGADVECGELLDDEREVLLGARDSRGSTPR